MKEEFRPAIAALQSDLKDIERKAAETKRAINRLCELAGMEAMYAVVDAESRPSIATLRADQFYGKVLNTAAREYLEMRQAANLGPATPREIFEALRDGGFKFETKIETNAITALRQVLRKNSSTFHRLDNGVYGLLVWYPNAKAAKYDDDDDDARPAATSKRTAKHAHKSKKSKEKPSQPDAAKSGASTETASGEPNVSLGPLILSTMNDDMDWTVTRLKEVATTWGVHGLTEEAMGRKIQGTLLSLLKQKLVSHAGSGVWRKAEKKAA